MGKKTFKDLKDPKNGLYTLSPTASIYKATDMFARKDEKRQQEMYRAAQGLIGSDDAPVLEEDKRRHMIQKRMVQESRMGTTMLTGSNDLG